MRYVGEHEVAYDKAALGFPSIANCLAVVYVTNAGLFGYHNLGGNAPASWSNRADGFAKFVASLTKNMSLQGYRMYGATYANNRHTSLADWTGELTAFADAVNFKGKIRGFDLGKSKAKGSAFVKFVSKSEKCEVFAQQWNDAEQTKGTVDNPTFLRYIKPNSSSLSDRTINVTTGVTESNLKKLSAIKLRG